MVRDDPKRVEIRDLAGKVFAEILLKVDDHD
jgi:hypothetical protein